MGIWDNAVTRTLAFVQGRQAPSYAPPASRPADGGGDTNSDTSVSFLRRWVSLGPARTAATAGAGAGSRPAPDGTLQGSAPSPGTFGKYKVLNDDVTNISGVTPKQGGKEMPYGLQPLDTADQPNLIRPGASTRAIPTPDKLGRKLS